MRRGSFRKKFTTEDTEGTEKNGREEDDGNSNSQPKTHPCIKQRRKDGAPEGNSAGWHKSQRIQEMNPDGDSPQRTQRSRRRLLA